jgi:hypothetical protein
MAALLACGEGAALSHRTAATIWGLVTGPTLPIDVTTSTDHGRKHARITAHRMRLHPFDALVRDNLRLTTPSRTVIDLAASLEGRALRDAVPRRPGTRRLHDLITVLAADEDNARSHLERLFLALTRRARLSNSRRSAGGWRGSPTRRSRSSPATSRRSWFGCCVSRR